MAVTEPEGQAPLVLEAGTPATGAFRCCDCGYGVSVRRVLPPRCPMCGGTLWEEAARPARRPAGLSPVG